MSEWSKADTAPKDKPILGYGPYEDMGVVQWSGNCWIYQADGYDAISYMDWSSTDYRELSVLTHWMPLPDKPKDEEQ